MIETWSNMSLFFNEFNSGLYIYAFAKNIMSIIIANILNLYSPIFSLPKNPKIIPCYMVIAIT